jgi:hypothetical protein
MASFQELHEKIKKEIDQQLSKHLHGLPDYN